MRLHEINLTEATGDPGFDKMMGGISKTANDLPAKYMAVLDAAERKTEEWFAAHPNGPGFPIYVQGQSDMRLDKGNFFFSKLRDVLKSKGIKAFFKEFGYNGNYDSTQYKFDKFLASVAAEMGLDWKEDSELATNDVGHGPAVSPALNDNTPLAEWYDEYGDQTAITKYIRRKLNLPADAHVYFDDADLVCDDQTVLRSAIYKPGIYMKDAINAVRAYFGNNLQEVTGDPKFDGMMNKISSSDQPQNFNQAQTDRVSAKAENPDRETIMALNKMMRDMHMTMQTADSLMKRLTGK